MYLMWRWSKSFLPLNLHWGLNITGVYYWHNLMSVDTPCFTGCDALTVTVSKTLGFFLSQHFICAASRIPSFVDDNLVAEIIFRTLSCFFYSLSYCELWDCNFWLFVSIISWHAVFFFHSLKPWLLHPLLWVARRWHSGSGWLLPPRSTWQLGKGRFLSHACCHFEGILLNIWDCHLVKHTLWFCSL